MANPFDEPNPFDDSTPMGGAEGGPGGSEPIQATPKPPNQKLYEYQQLLDARKKQISDETDANVASGGKLWHEMKEKDPQAFEEMSKRHHADLAARALSVASGVPFVGSHLDELAGAVQSRSFSGPEYEKKRNEARAAIDASQNLMPAGPIVGSLLLGPGPKAPGGAAGRIAMNAGMGASQGAGDAPTLADVPKYAAKGAGTGALVSGAAEGMAAAASPMQRLAEAQALKAAGLKGGIRNAMTQMGMTPEEAQQMGRRFLDEDLIPFAGSAKGVQERAKGLQGRAGNAIGATLTQAETSGVPFDYAEFGAAADQPLAKANAVQQMAGSEASRLARALEDQGQKTPGSYLGANDAKSSAWKSANFSLTAPESKRLYRQTAGAATGNIEDQVRRSAGDAAADTLKRANEQYGVAKTAQELADEAVGRNMQNRHFGLSELMAGLGGEGAMTASGHPGTGLIAGLASALAAKWLKSHGNSMAARALDAAAPVVGATGRAARLLAPGEIEAATHAVEPDEDKWKSLRGDK